jgi:hypothetical protein
MRRRIGTAIALALAAVALPIMAAKPAADSGIPSNPQRNAYFGDLHLHTGLSFDAAVASGVQLGPEAAYRFAMGEPVEVLGRKVQRKARLDFLAVTDHAEYLGMVQMARDPEGPFKGTHWPEDLKQGPLGSFGGKGGQILGAGFSGRGEQFPDLQQYDLKRAVWNRVIDAAEEFYRPGSFTTFVAFEWSFTPGNAHFHRNVIFPGPSYPDVPFSALDSRDVRDLWKYAEANRRQGIDSLLIPHNPNLSDGLAFSYTDSAGRWMDRAYAEMSSRNEPLVEITQIKGTSETHPELSPNDEFADFELMNHYLYSDPKKLFRPIHGSYVREGLQRGLLIEQKLGVNPFRYGFVGASDYHLAVSGTEEFNRTMALGADDISKPDALLHPPKDAGGGVLNGPLVKVSASGITGVWAERNTRESIFAALKRREVFATSGPRMKVRMFGGWSYPDNLMARDDWVATAYRWGAPMGGQLPADMQGKKAPRFLLDALKDPDSGNLDRIQMIKLWLDKDGNGQERIYDVAWSGERKPGADGKVPAVGNTVDLKTATYTNTIGAVHLATEWTDPDFDPAIPAIYYARVIEIPTPRWSTYLAVQNHLELSPEVPPTLQERAWTSPIYYMPRH